MLFTTRVVIAMKITTQVDSFRSDFDFFGLEKVSTNERPDLLV